MRRIHHNYIIAQKVINKVINEKNLQLGRQDPLMRKLEYSFEVAPSLIYDYDKTGQALVAVFKQVAEYMCKLKSLTEEQAQTILFEIFKAFLLSYRLPGAPSELSSFTDDISKKLLIIYRSNSLSKPYQSRDSDGDNVIDLEEFAGTRDPFVNDEISAADFKEARKLKDDFEDVVFNSKMDKQIHEATHRTYIGDQGTGFGKLDNGYIYFKPTSNGNISIPDSMRLNDRPINIESQKDAGGFTKFIIKRKNVVIAAIAHLHFSGIRYYYRLPKIRGFNAGRDIIINKRAFTPLKNDGRKFLKEKDLAIAFDHAFFTANTGRARLSHEDYNKKVIDFNNAREEEVNKIKDLLSKTTLAKAAKLEENISKTYESFTGTAATMSEYYFDLIAGSMSLGIIKMEMKSEDGTLILNLVNPLIGDGKRSTLLKNDEFNGIQRDYKKQVKNFEIELSAKSKRLVEEKVVLNQTVKEYFEFVTSYEFLGHLHSMEQPERCGEYAKIAALLLGSKVGVKFASQLWEEGKNSKPPNNLTLVSMILNEPSSKKLEVLASLAIVGQVAAISLDTFHVEHRYELYLRIVGGQQVNEYEREIIRLLTTAVEETEKRNFESDEKRMKFYLKTVTDSVIKIEGKVPIGVMKSIMDKFAGMLQETRKTWHENNRVLSLRRREIRQAANPRNLQPFDVLETKPLATHAILMTGTAGFSMLSFGISIRELFEQPSTTTIANAFLGGASTTLVLINAADSFRPIRSYAYVEKSTLSKINSIGSPILTAGSVVLELEVLRSKNSKLGRQKALAQLAVTGGTIIGGLIFGASPLGWAIFFGSIALKIGIGSSSKAYEQAVKELKKLSGYK